MFRSLIWKFSGAFIFVILLTVILSALLSLWTTNSQFNVLVTAESELLAQDLAPVLEAYYDLNNGNWQGLEDLININQPVLEEVWFSDVDWFQVAFATVGLDESQFFLEYENEAESVASVAVNNGIDPDLIVQSIVNAEGEAIDFAVREGMLTEEQAQQELGFVQVMAPSFVYGAAPDESILVIEELFASRENVEWLLGTLFFENQRLLIFAKDGVVVFDSEKESVGDIATDQVISQGVQLVAPKQGDVIGTLLISSSPEYYSSQQQSFLQTVNRSLVVGGIVAGVVGLFVGILLSWRVTSPVKSLTLAAQALASGEDPEKLPVVSNDEIGQMSVAFNTMADALAEQHVLRSRMLKDLAHDLNTPMSVIQLELDGLKDGLQTPAEASLHVDREISYLRKLINDLDQLSNNGHSQMKLQLENVDVGELLEEIVARWQPKCEAKEIKVFLETNEMSKTYRREANIDPLRITQVMNNLIDNALKYTSSGGGIEVKLGRDQDNACSGKNEDSASVVISVEDTGEGIPREDLPYIFERFYRVDKSRTRSMGGHGLGLSISHQIIEMHGGKIWATSEVGVGTKFHFSLPCAGDIS